MTVEELLEQAKSLSAADRRELATRLLDLPDDPINDQTNENTAHWGKSLNALMDDLGPVEMKYPEIEDPVEWVKHLRAESRQRRLGDWDREA